MLTQAGKAICKAIYQSRLQSPWEKLISSDEVCVCVCVCVCVYMSWHVLLFLSPALLLLFASLPRRRVVSVSASA